MILCLYNWTMMSVLYTFGKHDRTIRLHIFFETHVAPSPSWLVMGQTVFRSHPSVLEHHLVLNVSFSVTKTFYSTWRAPRCLPMLMVKIRKSSTDWVTCYHYNFDCTIKVPNSVWYYWQSVIAWGFLICNYIISRIWHQTFIVLDTLCIAFNKKIRFWRRA